MDKWTEVIKAEAANKWTNTIDIVVKVETAQAKGQWQIGDALKKDLGVDVDPEKDIPRSVFDGCGDKLKALGYPNYKAGQLAKLYRTSKAFKPQDRNPKYAWDIHFEAGTPANLKKLITALNKFSKPISGDNVHGLRVKWAEEAKEARRKLADAAAKKKDAASERKKKATEDLLAAKDKEAKAKAQKEREAAIKEIAELTETISKNTGTPPLNTDLDVNVEDVNSLRRWAVYLRVKMRIGKIEKEANEALKEVTQIANMLSENERDVVEKGCTLILDIIENILAVADRRKKSFIKLVREG
jgi:hypothetical protein